VIAFDFQRSFMHKYIDINIEQQKHICSKK